MSEAERQLFSTLRAELLKGMRTLAIAPLFFEMTGYFEDLDPKLKIEVDQQDSVEHFESLIALLQANNWEIESIQGYTIVASFAVDKTSSYLRDIERRRLITNVLQMSHLHLSN